MNEDMKFNLVYGSIIILLVILCFLIVGWADAVRLYSVP